MGRAAGTIAAYQEIGGGDPLDPLGARPGPGKPDAQARWDAADAALHGPPAAADALSDDDLQARLDRAGQLVADAPDIAVDRLRQAHQDARDEQTEAGLVQLDPSSAVEGDVDRRDAAGRADRLEQAQQQRQQWVADHGAEVAAGALAAAELARRQEERAARPFIDLDDDQLRRELRHAQDETEVLDRRAFQWEGVVEVYGRQAAQLDEEAQTVEWEHLAWAKVNQDRQAETGTAARLAEIDRRLDRGALRGGRRVEERAKLEVEALQLRSAHPALAAGTERATVWEDRAEQAWAHDKDTVEQFQTEATTLRGKADRVGANLGPLAEQRRIAQVRLDQLVDEGRQRQGEPPRPGAARAARRSGTAWGWRAAGRQRRAPTDHRRDGEGYRGRRPAAPAHARHRPQPTHGACARPRPANTGPRPPALTLPDRSIPDTPTPAPWPIGASTGSKRPPIDAHSGGGPHLDHLTPRAAAQLQVSPAP